jgi:hypothetical protein
MLISRALRSALFSAPLFVGVLTCTSAMAVCLGPGVNNGGTNNGWNVAPCYSGGHTGGSFSSGGSISSIGSELETAAAAVQAVGMAAGILGDVLSRLRPSSFHMPTFVAPSFSLPPLKLPSLPSLETVASPPDRAATQRAETQNDRAASCARIARIYETSYRKMATATQYVGDVNDSHPDKLCDFGRNVGLPLLQENVNVVDGAHSEICFGESDWKRLASFRQLLEDEKRAIANDCKRAIQTDVAAASSPPTLHSEPAKDAPASHPAPTVPHLANASGSSSQQGDLTHGLTQQQCSAQGGRIITFTNTAGQGPEVGDCYVPPQLSAGKAAGNVPPPQGSAPVVLGGTDPVASSSTPTIEQEIALINQLGQQESVPAKASTGDAKAVGEYNNAAQEYNAYLKTNPSASEKLRFFQQNVLPHCPYAAACKSLAEMDGKLRQDATQDLKQRVVAQISQGQSSTSCSTITDKDHPSAGPCKQARSTLDAARFTKSANPSLAKERYKDAAEAFQQVGDFAMAATAMIEGGVAPSALAPPIELDPSRFTLNVGDKASCEATIWPIINALNEEITQLISNEPPASGSKVPVGQCAARILNMYQAGMLFGPAPGVGITAVASQAANHEKRACLTLKADFLSKKCKCAAQGESFSTDPEVQDETIRAFKSVQELEKRSRDMGIVNPAVRKMVEKATNVHDCFNLNTIQVLNNTEKALQGAIGQ